MCRIVQDHAEVLQKEAVPQCRLDTHVGSDAGKDQRADAAAAQHAVEVGVIEGAVARFLDNDIAGLWQQVLDQLVVPASLGQQLALQFGPAAHQLQRIGLVPVGRARAARLDIVGVPAVLEEDHRHAGRARGVGGFPDLFDRRRGAGDVEAREIEIAARRGVGVLHVDDDQRRLGWPQQDRLGLCLQEARGGIVDREVADRVGHSAAFRDCTTCCRVFISGWIRSPKILGHIGARGTAAPYPNAVTATALSAAAKRSRPRMRAMTPASASVQSSTTVADRHATWPSGRTSTQPLSPTSLRRAQSS